ncbi:hypothetical protein [uncultured Intestinimonas sp.]|nr:hypothetical protein [uncultured Intestinimonas sp.]
MGSPRNRGTLFRGAEARQFYDLERLWKDAAELDLSEILEPN